MRSGFGWGFFIIMTYTITIDQHFAELNGLTLVQASALSSCLSLLHWSDTIALDGKVWYHYSEQKMCEDFPLLFGIAKRVYKNYGELENMGFIQTIKIGKKKYLRVTEKCADWNHLRTNSPKTDSFQSENGRTDSPKMDSNYIINNNYNINNHNIEAETKVSPLFPEEEADKAKQRLFRNSNIYALVKFDEQGNGDYTEFLQHFKGADYEQIDMVYYFHAVADWSDQANKKRTDRGWLATIRQFIRGDMEKGKLHTINHSTQNDSLFEEGALKFLNNNYR